MLILDDLLLSPMRGLYWIFREIHKASLQEQVDEAKAITTELSELYMMLETGRISETEFDALEQKLLDRLDAMQEQEISRGEASGEEPPADSDGP
jgi:hypothetical protein